MRTTMDATVWGKCPLWGKEQTKIFSKLKACSYGDPRDDYCDNNVVSLYEKGDEVIGIPPEGDNITTMFINIATHCAGINH